MKKIFSIKENFLELTFIKKFDIIYMYKGKMSLIFAKINLEYLGDTQKLKPRKLQTRRNIQWQRNKQLT